MKITYRTIISKPQVVAQAGTTDAARVTLRGYVNDYGFDLDSLAWDVRTFFFASRPHYKRLAYRDAIASCLGYDMNQEHDRTRLWNHVVNELNPKRRYGGPWRTGREDIPLDDLRSFAADLHLARADFSCPLSDDLLPATKLAIARTITFIRLLPPRNGRTRHELPDAEHLPQTISLCWGILRKHPHYRKKKTLNQHALDSIEHEAKESMWLRPHDIGELKRRLEMGEPDPALIFWFWPFVIFKHATRCRIESRAHRINNPCSVLWNHRLDRFAELWG